MMKFSKAGAPTTRRIAELVEELQRELQITYGIDHALVVMGEGLGVIASRGYRQDAPAFLPCVREGT